MPVGAVGIIGLTFAGISGYVEHDPNKALRWMLGGFSESTVWLIVGAFVFSIGYRKSGLGRRLALLLVHSLGRRTIGLGYAVAFSDLVLAPATPSNTARSGGTIYPIVSNIPRIYGSEPGPTAGRIGTYVMWTAFATTAVTSSLFLTALAPNAAALSIAKKIAGVDVGWSQWFIGFAPLGILLLILVPLLSYMICRPEVKESPEIVEWSSNELKAMGPLSRNEWIMAALVLLAMFLWICGSNPDDQPAAAGIELHQPDHGGLCRDLADAVDRRDRVRGHRSRKERVGSVLLFHLAADAVVGPQRNRLHQMGGGGLRQGAGGLGPTVGMILLVSFFFWVHYFFSSITSHAAAVLPVVLAVGSSIPGLSMPTLTLLCVYSLGLMGVISPYATGPAPMYYGSGYIGKGDFWKFGLIFGVIYFAGLLLIVMPWLRMV